MPNLHRKDILGLQEMSSEEIRLILETAETLKEIMERPIKKVPTLRGKTIVTLFYEASTRTRTSFELAAKMMSADVSSLSPGTSSVVKGESLKDTVLTLAAMGTDMFIIRHKAAGSPHFVAKTVNCHVINAGDGMQEHPTQGLLDMLTIREHKGDIEGLTVTIVGDILHSRVARSNVWGLAKMGATVRLCGPSTLLPAEVRVLPVEVYTDLDKALGLMVRHSVRENTCLKEWMVEKAPVLDKGSMVTILAQMDGLRVAVRGVALERGYPGQMVKVQNTMSQKAILARVIDSGNVMVEF